MRDDWHSTLESAGLVIGVPDSLLGPWIRQIGGHDKHQPAASEGAAIATAAAFAVGSGRVPIVYMQNSGLGNAVNPLMSLANKSVYSTPMVLVIGWRGELDTEDGSQKDEPQHNAMGKITSDLLELMGVPVTVCDISRPLTSGLVELSMSQAREHLGPVALLVRKTGVLHLEGHNSGDQTKTGDFPSRSDYAEALVSQNPDAFFIATTGHIAREMYTICQSKGAPERLFMVTGAMGHVVSVALGFALANPKARFVVVDGDGSFQMHSSSITSLQRVENLSYLVLNNGGHGSVGGQPTSAPNMSLDSAITGLTGLRAVKVEDIESFNEQIRNANFVLECLTTFEVSENLPRPSETHAEMASRFALALRRESK